MNSRTKRILSLVLTLCMLLSTFPVTALGLDTIPAQAQSQSTEVSKGSEIPRHRLPCHLSEELLHRTRHFRACHHHQQ